MDTNSIVEKLKKALQDNKIQFTEEEPGNLVVELPDDDQVLLIAEPEEKHYFLEYRGAMNGFGFRMNDVDQLIEQGVKMVIERLPADGNVH